MKCAIRQRGAAVVGRCVLLLALMVLAEGTGKPTWKQIFNHQRAPLPPGWADIVADHNTIPSMDVDYGANHPFEQNRNLQLSDPEAIGLTYDTQASYNPLRIRFVTEPLEARRGESATLDSFIDATLNEVLPEMTRVWSSHLSVYPVQDAIPLELNDCYGIYREDDFERVSTTGSDLVIYVSAKDALTAMSNNEVSVFQCTEARRAVSTVCAQDQFDRPVIGLVNFCVPNLRRSVEEVRSNTGNKGRLLQSLSDDEIEDFTLIALHEVAHVLGFSFFLFKYFRNRSTGEPLTPRPFTAESVTCVDGTSRVTLFPSNSTVQLGQTDRGLLYYDVVTPTVRTVARNHYNCPSLAGARLENQPLTSGSCVGSHWDERIALSELMGTVFSRQSSTDIVLSPLTLALLDDSGWYRVFYGNVQTSPFGRGLGCDFVNRDCIVNDQVPAYGRDVFCSTVNGINGEGSVSATEIVCDPTHTEFAACDLFDTSVDQQASQVFFPDDGVRYFSNPALASIETTADYCPLPTIPARVDCTSPDSMYTPTYVGESAGSTSRCVVAYFGDRVFQPACLALTCDGSQQKLRLGDQTCDFDFQELSIETVSGSSATLICPRLRTVCPQLFCPSACSGRGVCDWEATPRPKCNCFDSSDTTAACSGDDPTPAPSNAPDPTEAPTPTSFASRLQSWGTTCSGLMSAAAATLIFA